MRTASVVSSLPATQGSVASRKEPRATLCVRVEAIDEALRREIVARLRQTMRAQICESLGWRPERISRELGRVEKLSTALVTAVVETLHDANLVEDADAILSLFASHRSKIQTTGAVVIEMKNGQLVFNFEEGR